MILTNRKSENFFLHKLLLRPRVYGSRSFFILLPTQSIIFTSFLAIFLILSLDIIFFLFPHTFT